MLLSKDVVFNYIDKLVYRLMKSGKEWSSEDLYAIDSRKLIADVGKTARRTGRIMHGISDRIEQQKDAAKALGSAFANGTPKDWTVGNREKALVNEVGEEGLLRKGQFSIIPGGPHIESLQPDDVIFNAA